MLCVFLMSHDPVKKLQTCQQELQLQNALVNQPLLSEIVFHCFITQKYTFEDSDGNKKNFFSQKKNCFKYYIS